MYIKHVFIFCFSLFITFQLYSQENKFNFEEYLSRLQQKPSKFKVNKTREKIGGKKRPICFVEIQDSIDFSYYWFSDKLLPNPTNIDLEFNRIANNPKGVIKIKVSKIYNELVKDKSIVFFEICGEYIYYGYFEYDLTTKKVRVDYTMWADATCA
ncbi:MAG: hypothetical protein MK105_13760 [Crocinitomicaceae bacterium]|nr:hypothetical protein [Crocinitomicaceae bacterium]